MRRSVVASVATSESATTAMRWVPVEAEVGGVPGVAGTDLRDGHQQQARSGTRWSGPGFAHEAPSGVACLDEVFLGRAGSCSDVWR